MYKKQKKKKAAQKFTGFKKRNSEIKNFIDFFYEGCKKIRGVKPLIIHGKDGKLTKLALEKLSLSQLEQLSLWFLEKKINLKPTIGAMLSKKVLEGLRNDINLPDFWKEIDELYERNFKIRKVAGTESLARKFRPFTFKQITEIQEQVAKLERASKIKH